ncbi:MAG: electron transport complex subunit RsxC [Butyricicoccus sp.]|nr:electron transport complex subunit RsxC [Butyricicoccus sp.]
MRKLKGVRTPHRKNTAGCKASYIPIPPEVVIPMSMHIGAPAEPLVKTGDLVKVGQLIADGSGFVSSPVHASVSGRVKKLDEIISSAGRFMTAIVIESDGLQTPYEGMTPPKVETREDFVRAIRDSGVVGLGGAGFPSAVKLTVKDIAQVEYVLINGAECEPYITSDTRAMLDYTNYIWEGALMLRRYFEPKKIIFGIEANKPECIRRFQELCKSEPDIEVRSLPSLYPQGGEKVLVFNTTGRIVPEGKLPLDVGTIVINCTTLSSIARYIMTGIPLTRKSITVDGSAVAKPQNVIAPIGTPLRYIFDYCGGFKCEPKKVLYGGPMMGIAVPDLDQPVLKTTNAVLAFSVKDAAPPKETACIGCGRCAAHCPLRLMPGEITDAFKRQDFEMLGKAKVNLCMECGCCTFVCPAKRPLVQVNKLAKAALRQYQTEQREKLARQKAAEANNGEVAK